MIHNFNNITETKLKLYDIISTEEESRRAYFVDNDFFDNKYSLAEDLYYLKIVVRDVTEWVDYSEENEEKKKKENDNKIIFIKDYRKVLTK